MAYVAVRRNGRFEVRESVHTPRGPRARSLAAFAVLTDEVLMRAARRATRSFDSDAVVASARRAGAKVAAAARADGPDAAEDARASARRFVEGSRRMALSLRLVPERMDPGEALIDLLGFADAVRQNQPRRPFEELSFPPLSRLVAARRVAASAR